MTNQNFLYRGKTPLALGINRAKRNSRAADAKDRATVLGVIGAGAPKQSTFHKQLVRERHAQYQP